MELARDINRSDTRQSLGRRKDPEASPKKKYQVIAIEHAASARNREFVSCSVFETPVSLFTGRTSGTPNLGYLAGRPGGSSTISIYSGSGMRAVEME